MSVNDFLDKGRDATTLLVTKLSSLRELHRVSPVAIYSEGVAFARKVYDFANTATGGDVAPNAQRLLDAQNRFLSFLNEQEQEFALDIEVGRVSRADLTKNWLVQHSKPDDLLAVSMSEEAEIDETAVAFMLSCVNDYPDYAYHYVNNAMSARFLDIQEATKHPANAKLFAMAAGRYIDAKNGRLPNEAVHLARDLCELSNHAVRFWSDGFGGEKAQSYAELKSSLSDALQICARSPRQSVKLEAAGSFDPDVQMLLNGEISFLGEFDSMQANQLKNKLNKTVETLAQVNENSKNSQSIRLSL